MTKMFTEKASFILRAHVGGKATKSGGKAGSEAAGRKAAKSGKPLWDPKKLKEKDWFTCISYLNVTNIEGDKITVKNQLGGSWFISKDLLVRDMWSADHFDKEVKCPVTNLSEVLELCRDTVFKVQFRKKLDQKVVEEKLSSVKFADLKKDAELKKISKNLAEGELVEITGHLVESENHLGRSLIIDLNMPEGKNFRYVDHRTIEYIIFKNVKYSVGKKSTDEELPLKVKDYTTASKWAVHKLAKGNWFSSIQYYQVKKIVDKENVMVATPENPSHHLTMSRDILEYEMYGASLFEKEEKLTRSNLVELMVNARDAAVTVKFHTKVTDAYVKEVLESCDAKAFKDSKGLSK